MLLIAKGSSAASNRLKFPDFPLAQAFTPGLVSGVNPQAPFMGLSLMPSGERRLKSYANAS